MVVQNGNRTFTTTTTLADLDVIGVVIEAIAAGADGRVRHGGYTPTLKVTGAVAAGDYLATSATIVLAESVGATMVEGAFALALTSAAGPGAGTVAAYVFFVVGATGGGASFATPAILLSTAAAAGVATTVIRSDSTIAAFDATVPVTQAAGDAAATGAAAFAARRDHRHGMPSTYAATAHNLLSATHGDSLAGSVVDGDVIIGNVTPAWSRLAITVPAANILNVLGVVNGETRPSWKSIHDGTAPVTQAFGDVAAAGTSLIRVSPDHKHGMPAAPTTIANDTIWAALGDTVYGTANDAAAILSGNITTTRKFLRQVGDGAASAAPAWDTIADADVPATHSGSAHHASVTLDVNADTILSLSTQALGLDAQTANFVFAGPTSGGAAVPAFRALIAADIPDLSGTYVALASANYVDLTDGGATTLHSHAGGGGNVATDTIWDAAGDMVQGTAADTAARIAGVQNAVLQYSGSTTAWVLLPLLAGIKDTGGTQRLYIGADGIGVNSTNVVNTALQIVTANATPTAGQNMISVTQTFTVNTGSLTYRGLIGPITLAPSSGANASTLIGLDFTVQTTDANMANSGTASITTMQGVRVISSAAWSTASASTRTLTLINHNAFDGKVQFSSGEQVQHRVS